MNKAQSLLIVVVSLWPALLFGGAPELLVDRIFGVYSDERPAIPLNDGTGVVVQSPLGFLSVYVKNNGDEAEVVSQFSTNESISALALSPDDSVAYCVTYSKLAAFRLSDGARLREVPLPLDPQPQAVWNIWVAPDDSFLVVTVTGIAASRLMILNATDLATRTSADLPGLKAIAAIHATGGYVYTIANDTINRVDVEGGAIAEVAFAPTGLHLDTVQFGNGRLTAISSTARYTTSVVGFPPTFNVYEDTDLYLETVFEGDPLWDVSLRQFLGTAPSPPSSQPRPGVFRGLMTPAADYVLVIPQGDVYRTADGANLGTIPDPRNPSLNLAGTLLASLGAQPKVFDFRVYELASVGDGIALTVPALRLSSGAPAGVGGMSLAGGRLADDGSQGRVVLRPDGSEDCAPSCGALDGSAPCSDISSLAGVPGTDLLSGIGDALAVWDGCELAHTYFYRGLSPLLISQWPSRDGSALIVTRRVFAPDCEDPNCPIIGTNLEVYDPQSLASGMADPLVSIEQIPTHHLWRGAVISRDDDLLYAYAASPAGGSTYDLLLCYSMMDGSIIDSAQMPRGSGVGIPSVTLALDDGESTLYVGTRSTLNLTQGFVGGVTRHDPFNLAEQSVLSNDGTVGMAVTGDGAVLAQRIDLNVRVWDARTGEVAAAVNLTESADQVPIALCDEDSKLLTHSGFASVRWSLDVPELNVIHAREAVLTSSGEMKWDRNGDGVLDAADFVIVPE